MQVVVGLAAGFSLLCLAMSPALAQGGGFRCPKPRTVIGLSNQTTSTFQGADPRDPDVCVRNNSGVGEQRLLFNYWIMPIRGDEASVRAAMRALLSGQSNEVSFNITIMALQPGQPRSDNFQNLAETFRRIGQECLTIGGKAFTATVFERTEIVAGRTNERKVYYDPASGVFLGTGDAVRDGISIIPGGRMQSVTVP